MPHSTPRLPAPPGRETRPGLADLHLHTVRSDGLDTPAQIIEQAQRRGFDVVAVTDHDTLEGALEAEELASLREGLPDVIVGEEVSSRDGHIIGLFLGRRVEPGLPAAETVQAIQEQGGLAIAAHPFWRDSAHNSSRVRHSVGELVESIPFDAVEVVNGGLTPSMRGANRRACEVAGRLRLTGIGASDAHVRQAVGWAHTVFPGRTANDLRAAILGGQTSPGRLAYGPIGLTRYVGWGLDRRPRAWRGVASLEAAR